MPNSGWQHRVQICKVNRMATETVVREELRQLNCHVQVEECLDECTRCERLAFALVDGRMHTAASARGIIDLILRLNSLGDHLGGAGRNKGSDAGKR